jgi:4-amino-4-deoxy-L-arabinose transferase-like glycosyltransferase
MTTNCSAIWFWSITGVCAVLWIVLPTLFHSGYRPDVIELLLIGKEWTLSTTKHPMLPAWILESINIITNRSFASPFIAAQLCMVIALWSIWQFGRTVLSEKLALAGSFALLPYWYFTVEAVKFNQNIALIAFWSLSVYFVWKAMSVGRNKYWILSGLSLGLAFHAKYSAALLVIAILLYMTFRSEGRKHWKTCGPYLTTLIAFTVFLPQIIWVYQHDFVTLQYAGNNISSLTETETRSLAVRIFHPLEFFANNLLFLILPLCVLIPAIGWCWQWRRTSALRQNNEAGVFLAFITLVPLGLLLVAAVIRHNGVIADYGSILWMYIGVWMLLYFRSKDGNRVFSRILQWLAIAEMLMIAVFFIQLYSPYWTKQPNRFQYPMFDLGRECNRIWNDRYTMPCPYLGGAWFLAGNAAWTMQNRPSVVFYWSGINEENAAPTGTWSSDTDINQHGGMILWQMKSDSAEAKDVPNYLPLRYPKAEILPEALVLPYKTGAQVPPLRVGVAVIPPPVP